MMHQLLDLNPETYIRHRIHTQERDWAETNCYVDIWIELLHALGHEPLAAMAYTLAIDFEGDQWTFFKFPLSDLYELYKIDVQELAVWQPLVKHVDEQVGMGRPVLVELDSYYLPDTAGTAYKIAHVKSTVAVIEFDISNNHMGYFHGQGYYHLNGDDFIDVFRLRSATQTGILPPYVEIAKLREPAHEQTNSTLDISMSLLRKQIRMLPVRNPFSAYEEKLLHDIEWLISENMEVFHQYCFATLRQFGACYELAANYLKWLSDQGIDGLNEVSSNLRKISEAAKIYQFQLARAVSRKKPTDTTPIRNMGDLWQSSMDSLVEKYS